MLDKTTITPDPLLEALRRALPEQPSPIPKGINSVQTIIRAASRHSGYSPGDLISRRHQAPLARVRHIVMYLSHRLTSMSFPKIGQLLGDRDHTTIMHGVRKIERLIQIEDRLADDIAAIRALAVESDTQLGAME